MTDLSTELSAVLDRWHRNSCHPDATTGDISVGVDAILAAIRASGRLAPEVGAEVIEAAIAHVVSSRYVDLSLMPEDSAGKAALRSIRRDIEAAAPLIAAAAEAKAREECVRIVQQYSRQQEDVLHDSVKVWDAEQVGAACSDIIAAIRTGAAP